MTKITREYLDSIGFSVEEAKQYNPLRSFSWEDTHEGTNYWSDAEHCIFETGVLREEFVKKFDEMIRVWEASEAKPEQPAIEFCITDGPGTLIDFGFETGMLRFDGFNAVGTVYVAPCTTACVTGA